MQKTIPAVVVAVSCAATLIATNEYCVFVKDTSGKIVESADVYSVRLHDYRPRKYVAGKDGAVRLRPYDAYVGKIIAIKDGRRGEVECTNIFAWPTSLILPSDTNDARHGWEVLRAKLQVNVRYDDDMPAAGAQIYVVTGDSDVSPSSYTAGSNGECEISIITNRNIETWMVVTTGSCDNVYYIDGSSIMSRKEVAYADYLSHAGPAMGVVIVCDTAGRPISGARVYSGVNVDSATIIPDITDANGVARFICNTSEHYVVYIYKDDKHASIDVRGITSWPMNVMLTNQHNKACLSKTAF